MRRESSLSGIYTMAVAGVFLAGFFLTVIFGAQTYREIADGQNRNNEARALLSNTDKSISAIIDELGFSNRSHFYRLFEKAYGQTPLDYRRQCRSAGL